MGTEIGIETSAKVSAKNDLTVTIEFTDLGKGERVSAETDSHGAFSLLHSLLMRFDPCVDQLRFLLLRHGLQVVNADAFEKRFGVSSLVPDNGRGVYVLRDSECRWVFGRAKGGDLHWEESDVADLLDLGIKVGELQRIRVGEIARFVLLGAVSA